MTKSSTSHKQVRMQWIRIFVFLIISILLTTISTVANCAENLGVEQVTLVSRHAQTTFAAEIANTDDLRSQGLMFRQNLPRNHAMLFDFKTPRPVSMWMKNTPLSLDMIFIRANGTIAAFKENTVPYSLDILSVKEPVLAVLEVRAGTVKELHLQLDDRVIHQIFYNRQ